MWPIHTRRRGPPQRARWPGCSCWTSIFVLLSVVALGNVYWYSQRTVKDAKERGVLTDPVESLQGLEHGTDAVEADEAAPAGTAGVALHPRVLPLGRDRPLTVLHLDGPHRDGVVYDGDTALVDFPCSLTEYPENLAGGGVEPRKRLNGPGNQRKPSSSRGPCVISCSDEVPRESPTEAEVPAATPGYRASVSSVKMAGNFTVEDVRRCERAFRACVLYQECTHVVLPSPGVGSERGTRGDVDGGRGAGTEGGYATLMHFPQEDNSLSAIEAAAGANSVATIGGANALWGGAAKGFTLDGRQRTYYVVSFGGSGSKMLGGWLSERSKDYVKQVFHLHDPKPAGKLFAKDVARGVRPGKNKGTDFRGYDFPEGAFPTSGREVDDVDSYRVVLIFKDPVEALISRYFYAHCKNLRGADCGGSPEAFPSIERYAEEKGEDRLKMRLFYENYCTPQGAQRLARNYPVVCVNYHKIWDNPAALVRALGLPGEEAEKLPVRTETVRNDITSAARGEPFTLALREKLREKHYSLSESILDAPAVAVV